ncbi:MAG: SDR family oxidoreductase [Pseudomonadota bacterium]|nr:SDR family oxidoreductase [Pseudomonadota bacterium]
MSVRLKPLDRQVIVLTGASSGIGLATARMAAERGASLVLVARNEEALRRIADEIAAKGGRAIPVMADVGKEDDVERVARKAIESFGGFDSWVNGAAVAIYGTIEQVPLEDQRKLFDTNYWGVVHGSLMAVKHLRRRGGALVNVGSVLSDRAVPLQGSYSAAKHAVKGFTDALRMELERDKAPISVTLIKPSAIDTPYTEHARNHMDAPSRNPAPAYAPQLVAKAILHACEHPKRDLVVGSGGWVVAVLGNLLPRVMDRVMEAVMFDAQKGERPARPERRDNLRRPRQDGAERSSLGLPARQTSLLLEAQIHPWVALACVAGLGFAAAQLARSGRGGGR